MPKLVTQYPAIPEPTQDTASLLLTVQRLKEAVELLTGQRTDRLQGVGQAVFELQNTTENSFARIRQVDEVAEQLAQRTVDLEVEVEGARAGEPSLNARFTEVLRVQVEGDTALSESIETVSASVGEGTANGQIRFTAVAAPSGYSAAYSLNLTAGNAQTGLQLLAASDGTASITFTAGQFRLFDPGLGPIPVFDYTAGAFQFNVPVRLLGEQVENRGITNSVYNINNTQSGAGAGIVEVAIETREGAQVDIFGDFDGAPLAAFPLANANQILRLQRVTGGVTTTLRDKAVCFYAVRGTNNEVAVYFTYTGLTFRDTPPAGTHTYRLTNTSTWGPVSIKATELFK